MLVLFHVLVYAIKELSTPVWVNDALLLGAVKSIKVTPHPAVDCYRFVKARVVLVWIENIRAQIVPHPVPVT